MTTASASSTPRVPGQAGSPGHRFPGGVCEVPNWGYQLSPSRVLDEMRDVGLAATELGPQGFLPADPDQMAEVLAAHQLTAVGGFTPLVMHRPGHDPFPVIDRILEQYQATHAEVLVLSATSGVDGDSRPTLDHNRWDLLLRNLNRISDRAAELGARAVLHPHVGTMVENGDEVQRVLSGSSISLCLDAGHLLIGGTDPADLTRRETIVNTLQGNGYTGWYTLEQDTILTEEPRGEGPVTDVRTSAAYVRSLLTTAGTGGAPTR